MSPYARRGAVDDTHDDHVSILKYTEANWHLSPSALVIQLWLPRPGQPQPSQPPAAGPTMLDA
ncbi:MAG TPA: hypothetical protein VF933_01050 [Streptosporangiaceae bacterium]